MRVFKTRFFAKFARKEKIKDAALCEAVARAGRGLIDATLCNGLIKQRVARQGEGRSGGFRTIIAVTFGDRAVFSHGFAKSETENIDEAELVEHKLLASRVLPMSTAAIEAALKNKFLSEVNCGGHEV